MNDQWTVSTKGRPFHNLALDEAHVQKVNANHYKGITLSHGRTLNSGHI